MSSVAVVREGNNLVKIIPVGEAAGPGVVDV
jgi:hypothetical protein